MNYSNNQPTTHNVAGMTFNTQHAVAALVIGSLAILILVRRGFRGVGIPGIASVGLK